MQEGYARLKRLRWQGRRGMKELDVLLENFLEKEKDQLLAGGWPQLESLLDQEDDVLFDWISSRNLPADPAMLQLIDTLTHA